MDWTKFNTHGESYNHAFEVMCNLLFEAWCKKEYGERLINVAFVNGVGGDGGVEAYATLTDGSVIGIQSKWFPDKLDDSQIRQIKASFSTAITVRPYLSRYIVCIPRDLGSQRIVKGGKVSRNTEENRWVNLKDSFHKTASTVVVELWDETRIQEIITWPELVGIYKFWFDNSEFFDNYFELSFMKAISSWAKTEYIPDLYAEGHIHQKIEFFLGSSSLSERRYNEWCKMLERLTFTKRSLQDLLALEFPESEKDLVAKIKIDLVTIDEWISILESGKESVKRGIAVPFENDFDLKCTSDIIKKSSLHFRRYFHFSSVEKVLDSLIDDFYNFKVFLSENNSNRLILLGNPGSGKTTGIVSEAGLYLENKEHLPILVRAKDFSEGETWGTIIEKTLGISSAWDEKELFFALQSSALISRRCVAPEQFDVVSKCVIFVDGIDEAESWDFWKRRIEEIEAYKELYPRVKFVFLSRPYVFGDIYKLSYRNDISSTPYFGDVNSIELCDAYFKKYKISVGNNPWIKTLLKTPIAVRLFCDIYRGTVVESIDNNTVVITKLFRKKIELLEERFKRQIKKDVKGNVQNILCEVAELFAVKENLSEKELTEKLDGSITNYLSELIKFLEEEGFIYSYRRQKNDYSPVMTYYSWGMQPTFDYLIARKLFEAIERDEQINIEYTSGIYQMLSLILLEEKGILIFQCSNIKIDDDVLFDLVCYTLSSASIYAVAPYREYFKKLMSYSAHQFRELVNQVIIPVSVVDGHPLGAELLDEFLRSFKSSAERDIWWSIPGYLRDNYKTEWGANTEISFEDITLRENDSFATSPLILAWSLSSVNNEIRQHSRMKLITWGIKNPNEFWKLFLKVADLDDDQILEDIFAVAYGIALDQHTTDKYIEEASKWALVNVFSPAGLKRYENSAIRYYSGSIVKIAIFRKIEKGAVKDEITPPFSYELELPDLALEAISAERMRGYMAIDYDLSRYVLCDYLDGFFRTNNKKMALESDSAAFLERYKSKYKIEDLHFDGLIISMAYQYLKGHGWDPDVFWQYDDAENYGVDRAIHRTYFAATHGSKSRIMTVAEKNVWLARHHIECVLANEIPYKDWSSYEKEKYLDDYSYLEDFINPYQDYVNKNHYKVEECWFHMDLLAKLDVENPDEKAIEQWMQDESIPDFKSWLFGYDGLMLLDTFTNAVNDTAGIEETIWVSTGVVEKKNMQRLIDCLKVYSEEREEFLNHGGFHAAQDCRCYCTPQEACVVHPDKEIESSILFSFGDETIEVKKASAICLSADEMDVEKTFYFPSSFIRRITGITFGDGFEYKDSNGNVIASFFSNGENWGTQQEMLLIKQDKLMKALERSGYTPIWVFRVYKSPSSKSYERYPKILHDTDVTYLIWLEDEIKYMPLEELKPPIGAFDNTRNEILEQILSQLN